MSNPTAPRLRRDDAPRAATTVAAVAPGWLASPSGMLVAIPLLVAISAGAVLLITQTVMRGHAQSQAMATFQVQARTVRARVDEVLGQAGPLLDQMADGRADADLADPGRRHRLAVRLADAMRGRPGVAQLLVADEAGRFLAVGQDGGAWIVLTADAGERRTWALGPDGLAPGTSAAQAYDPRQRPWFREAAAAEGAVWTQAYRFARTGRTGITCARAIAGSAGRVVVGVDFDLESLAGALAPVDGQAVDPVLFTHDRAVLAAPQGWVPAAADAVVRLPDLVPEGPRRLLASFAALPAAGDPPVRIPTEAGWGGSVISVPVPAGPLWYLGTIVSEESIYGPSRAALRSSLLAGLVAVVAGSVAAAFFASHLARSRRETAAQRERARRAEAAADDLGSYRLVRLLGRGGMGEVWLAEHRLLARQAAIKRIISAGGDLASAEGRQRFLQEARITASLRCRNTIELYDYGVADDGGLYFAMELLDGCDLRELVRRSGPLPVGRMVHLMVQACRSLAEAHLRGLVHRDIKPENLYACRRADEVDILKVLDFGIATVSERRAGAAGITQAGYVQGTPATMAPEQACGEQLDGRADIYALGCVMFILLTGEDPFQGSDAYGTIAAHLGEAPDAPSARSRRPLPAEVDRLVLACMAKERDGRPADAAVLAEALLALPVPDGEEWSQVRARAWWLQHVPAAPTSASGETTAAVESAR